ncbi:hypothetical protein K3495_g15683, partial [Podosphaera aphanis]
ILYEARLPHQLWDYAIEHAVWIKNRVPTAALPFEQIQERTPFKAYYNKTPSLKNLRVFGCKADILYPPDLNPQTWVPRIREGKFIMIGMQSLKIWKLLDTLSLKEAVSADVKFNEYSFRNIDAASISNRSAEEVLTPKALGERMAISGRPKGVKQKGKVYTPMYPTKNVNDTPSTVNAPSESIGGQPRVERRSSLNDTPSTVNAPSESIGGQPRVERRSSLNDTPSTVNAPSGSMGGQPRVERRSSSDLHNDKIGSIQAETEIKSTQVNESLDQGSTQSVSEKYSSKVSDNTSSSKSERRSRYGRLIRDRAYSVFSRDIAVAATSSQIVHINQNDSSSIQVPTPPFESITIEQAMVEDKKLWTEAIFSELKSLEKTGTFTIMKGQLPKARKVISSKTVLRKKLKSDGTLARRKARIVVRGFEQEYGTDYFE